MKIGVDTAAKGFRQDKYTYGIPFLIKGALITLATGGQTTADVVCVICAVAAIVVALRVVAVEITLAIGNIIEGTRTPFRRTGCVVAVVRTVAVVEVAPLVIASEVAVTIAES